MFQYEIFRQSVIGWAGLLSVVWVAYPGSGKGDTSSAIITFIAALLSGPVVGYVVSQLNRLYYSTFNRRPNDRSITIEDLHRAVQETKNDPILAPLAAMRPKDLERLLWVALANTELRFRAESYWERYYTNVCMALASWAGAAAGIAFLVYRSHSLETNVIHFDELLWLCGRVAVLSGLNIALLAVAKEYRRVADSIEDAWNRSIAARWATERYRLRYALIRS